MLNVDAEYLSPCCLQRITERRSGWGNIEKDLRISIINGYALLPLIVYGGIEEEPK